MRLGFFIILSVRLMEPYIFIVSNLTVLFCASLSWSEIYHFIDLFKAPGFYFIVFSLLLSSSQFSRLLF